MRSCIRSILFFLYLLSVAPLFLVHSQPRSAQTEQRTPQFHHFFHPFIKYLPNIIPKSIFINTDIYAYPVRETLQHSFCSCPSACFATTASSADPESPPSAINNHHSITNNTNRPRNILPVGVWNYPISCLVQYHQTHKTRFTSRLLLLALIHIQPGRQ
jgi:hypothetical protein